MEIVNLMIDKGATNYDKGLCYSCAFNHIEIVH